MGLITLCRYCVWYAITLFMGAGLGVCLASLAVGGRAGGPPMTTSRGTGRPVWAAAGQPQGRFVAPARTWRGMPSIVPIRCAASRQASPAKTASLRSLRPCAPATRRPLLGPLARKWTGGGGGAALPPRRLPGLCRRPVRTPWRCAGPWPDRPRPAATARRRFVLPPDRPLSALSMADLSAEWVL